VITKLNCFTQAQWDYYIKDVSVVKNGKTLDVCFDCTDCYQKQMSREGKCQFPNKRIDQIAEYA
jgi:hypothetical protein